MKIVGVFFDIGWTLMYPALRMEDNWFLTPKFYEMLSGSNFYIEKIKNSINKAMPILYRKHKMKTLLEEEQIFILFYQNVIKEVPELNLNLNCARELAFDMVYNMRNRIMFEDAKYVLEELNAVYKLGIISNTWPSGKKSLKSVGLYDFFENFTFSYESGVFKPDARIYQEAIPKMKLPTKNIYCVDDSADCLIEAKKQGMIPIQINIRPNNKKCSGALKINTLSELLTLLL